MSRPREWNMERFANLYEDGFTAASNLSKKYGRKPKLPEIAKELRKRFPDKYEKLSVEWLRQNLARPRILKQKGGEDWSYLRELSEVMKEIVERQRTDARGGILAPLTRKK